jgi:hypothetical protein
MGDGMIPALCSVIKRLYPSDYYQVLDIRF